MHVVAVAGVSPLFTEPCLGGEPPLLGDASGSGPHGWYVGFAFVRLFVERHLGACGLRRMLGCPDAVG
jgi:hypothetical protein